MQSREAMLVNPFQGGNADTEVENRPVATEDGKAGSQDWRDIR